MDAPSQGLRLALDQAGFRLRLGAGELDNVGDHGTLVLVDALKRGRIERQQHAMVTCCEL